MSVLLTCVDRLNSVHTHTNTHIFTVTISIHSVATLEWKEEFLLKEYSLAKLWAELV